jgi:transcriptional regulator with XRE-family HTH domain
MAKKFSALRAKMTPEAQSRAAARAEAMLVEMQLQELRKSRNVTQVELAGNLHVEQAAISRLERREDMYVSTLREYVRALGGELKLVASFPDGEIQLHTYDPARGTQPRPFRPWERASSASYPPPSADSPG